MPDIFDELEVESRGDIFDEVAAESFSAPPIEINQSARFVPSIRDVTAGGPRASFGDFRPTLGAVGDEFGDFYQNLHTPTFNLADPLTLPEREALAGESKGTQRTAGVYESLANTANFFTSPMGVATLGIGALPRAAQKVIAGIFAVTMGKEIPEIATQLGEELGKPEDQRDDVKLAELITTAATTTGLAALTGKHALTPTPKALKLADEIGAAEFTPRPDDVVPIEQATRFPRERVTTEPFLQPGIPELADLALREAGQVIIDPKQDAIGALRRAIEPPVIEAQPLRTLERPREAGETIVRPEFSGVRVEPGFERTASDLLLERPAPELKSPEIPNRELKVADETVRTSEQPLNPGGSVSSLSPELKAIESANQAKQRQIAEDFKKSLAEQKPVESTPKTFNSKTTANEIPQPEWEVLAEKFVDNADSFHPGRDGMRDYDLIDTIQEFMDSSKSQRPSKTLWDSLKEFSSSADKPEAHFRKLREILKDEGFKPSPKTATEKLSSLKFKADKNGKVIPDDPGQVFSLPHPDAIAQIGKQLWNDSIDVAIAAVKAGKSVKEALDGAMQRIRFNAKSFDETQLRANLETILSQEAGEKKPVASVTESVTVERPALEGDNIRMRTLSERATTSEKIPGEVQERIAASPESYYAQQSLKGVEKSAREKTDIELAATSRESNTYTADKLELSTRLLNAGKHEEGYRVFQDLSQDLTRMGQVINQAKLFQALRPEHVVTVMNKDLVKAGRDPLTPEQTRRIEGLAKDRISTQAELNKATDQWMKNPTDENSAIAESALEAANKAAVNEQTLVNQFQPRKTSAMMKTILQGNLLTPISQVANIVGNVSFTPGRAGARSIGASIDMLDAAIRNRPRQLSVDPAKGSKAVVEGLIKGAKQIPSILSKGTGETLKGEQRSGLHPARAWVKQFAKNPDVPTVGGRIPFSERVNLAIEGTMGAPAEMMLRGLGAGDVVFREAARARLISEASRLGKLDAKQTKMAQSFPELFFDRATLERIDNETRGAVFQRHSKTIDRIMELSRSKGDLMDFMIATVAPYKLTPWNIVGEIISYNPLVATGRSLLEAKRGNIREAEINAGKAFVGGMTIYAGYWLYEKGLLSPSLDTRDEQQESRILAGEVMPPNHINVSGLKRAMNGEDPSFRPGDETVDIFRGGGLAGSMFYMVANVGRDAEKSASDEEMILSLLKNSTLEQARFGLNQSFLKGVTGLLDAVRYGETDNYLTAYANGVLSLPLPNTLSALSRAEREYKVDGKGEAFTERMKNLVKTRLGFAGLDDYLPLKRGLWGEPLRETPKDRNALVYHLFDISKNQQVTSDPVSLELYRLWRKTTDTGVIPTPPRATIAKDNQTYNLTPAQHSRYAELVGTTRKSITDRVVRNPNYHKLDDAGKIKILETVYRDGMEAGKALFLKEHPVKSLSKKPVKSGFTPKIDNDPTPP